MDPQTLIAGLGLACAALLPWACKDVPPKPVPAAAQAATPAPTPALPAPLPPDDADSKEAGAALFLKACSHCHGDRGRGDGLAGKACKPPPADFQDAERLSELSDAEIYARLTHGKDGTCMPSFKASLSDGDRLVLVRQVRRLAAPVPVSAGAP